MATMAWTETFVSKRERIYAAWLEKVESILGSKPNESSAYDLFVDGCASDEAAAELLATA